MLALVAVTARAGRAHAEEDARRAPATRLAVPHTAQAITIDGELSDAAWPNAARTRDFRAADGSAAKPYSEALFAADDRYLYVALYAADEHLEAAPRAPDGPVWLDDDFHVVFELPGREVSLDVSARGVLTDGVRRGEGSTDYRWSSGARVVVDADGTMNDPSDLDEEWVAEIAIPLSALGLDAAGGHADVRIQRWDVTRGVRAAVGGTRVRLELGR